MAQFKVSFLFRNEDFMIKIRVPKSARGIPTLIAFRLHMYCSVHLVFLMPYNVYVYEQWRVPAQTFPDFNYLLGNPQDFPSVD